MRPDCVVCAQFSPQTPRDFLFIPNVLSCPPKYFDVADQKRICILKITVLRLSENENGCPISGRIRQKVGVFRFEFYPAIGAPMDEFSTAF